MRLPQLLTSRVLAIYLCTIANAFMFFSCKVRQFRQSPDAAIRGADRAKRPSTDGLISLEEYGKSCEDALGPMPKVIDCKKGTAISFADVHVEANTMGSGRDRATCRNPSFGVPESDACAGVSFVVNQENDLGTKIVTICRFAARDGAISVAATIAHNPKSGGTCFFQFRPDTAHGQSGKLPGPTVSTQDEPVTRNWETPAYVTNVGLGTCVECHSAYPWVRNPYVVPSTDSPESMVPKNGGKFSPYWVVARARLEEHHFYSRKRDEWAKAEGLWTPVVLDEERVSSELGRAEGYCMNCHRLGRGRFLRTWSPAAVGFFPASQGALEGIADPARYRVFSQAFERLSADSKVFPQSNWHWSIFQTGIKQTKHSGEKISLAEWNKQIFSSMNLIYECGTLPKNCVWKALPEPDNSGGMVSPKLNTFPYNGNDLGRLRERLESYQQNKNPGVSAQLEEQPFDQENQMPTLHGGVAR